MLLHCVFCHFDPSAAPAARMALLEELAVFSRGLDGVEAFDYGPNLDYENKSPNHSEGFVIRFRDRAAHLAYDAHPRHQELGARLCAMCVGGAAGVVVYDLEV